MNNPEHPIIFSTPMVQALLNMKPGTWPAEPIDPSKPYKCMTRRVVKPQPDKDDPCIGYCTAEGCQCFPKVAEEIWAQTEEGESIKLKTYSRGDILWVRETWRCIRVGLAGSTEFAHIGYKCSEPKVIEINNEQSLFYTTKARWRPSIHMPREAARLFLKVESVRVERLQDITEGDAKKEGITIDDLCNKCPPNVCGDYCHTCGQARHRFSELWDSLNAKRGYSWESNPYVFAYEFMRVR